MSIVSLHTAEPQVGGLQSSSEATYAGYARIPLTNERLTFPTVAEAAPQRLTHLAQGNGTTITKVFPLKPSILTQKDFGVVLEGKDFQ